MICRGGRRICSLLCVVAAAALPLSRAHATTFVRMDEQDLAARAAAVVIATVESVQSETAADGAIITAVVLLPERVLRGTLPAGPVTLHERGGAIGGRTEHIFGSPDYQVGEHVLVFLSRGGDGALRTTAMAMGKYDIEDGAGGDLVARRTFESEVAVLDPVTGKLEPGDKVETANLSTILRHLSGATPSPSPLRSVDRTVHASAERRLAQSPFTYLGDASRWFEPDAGLPVTFGIDARGDTAIGPDASMAAAVDAMAAWSEVDGAAVQLVDGPLDEAMPFAGCDGQTRVVFNDPFDEIDTPVDCRGVLGIGGFCQSAETRTVNGTEFKRIELGKVLIADGFAGCAFWTPCNLAEVLTHEIGHALGLGHSKDTTATMRPSANFDGRCANLAADDIAGLRSLYPLVATPTRTPTATAAPPTRTGAPATRTPTRMATKTRTSTPRSTPTRRVPGQSDVSGRIRYYANSVGVPGATVTLHGAGGVQRTTTGNGGEYIFSGVSNGAWSVEPTRAGDMSVAVNALDAAWILQVIAGTRTLTAIQRMACDVSGDGTLSALDAARILQFETGTLARLPAADMCQSDWLFAPVAASEPGQVMAMPSLAADGCQRGAVVLDSLQNDARGLNLEAAVFGDCTGNWRPAGSAVANDAPAGTELAMPPLRRRPGGRWLQPVGVRAPDGAHSLELELRYDDTRLQFVGVRSVNLGDLSLVSARSPQPGRIIIAAASADAFPADGRPLAIVEFASAEHDISPRSVRPFTANVDELVMIGR
jgi:hypothetical protein